MVADKTRIHTFQKVTEFLKKMGQTDMEARADNLVVNSPVVVKVGKTKALKLTNTIIVSEKWILSKTLLIFRNAFQTDQEAQFNQLCRAMLKANFDYPEVTYSLDPAENIFVEADMPLDTTYENFQSEIASQLEGAKAFFTEICPSVDKKIKNEDTWKCSE